MTAELIAAIEENHDEDAISIYADWLLEQGDPLGELIVLHRSTEVDPAVPGPTRDFVMRHATALLGELAAFDEACALDWRLGLVDRVRIASVSPATIAAALAAMVSAPVCRFVRELEIEAYRADYAPIEQQLIALARPASLRRIQFGRVGERALVQEIYRAFPRIPRTDHTWERLRSSIHPVWGLDFLLSDDEVPLADAAGVAIPLSASELLHGLCLEQTSWFGLGDKVREVCGAGRLDAWLAQLIGAGKLFSHHATVRQLIAEHGGVSVVAALEVLLATTEQSDVARTVIAMLEAMTLPEAHCARYRRLRTPTRAIDRAKPRRDFDVEALLARVTPARATEATIYEALLASGLALPLAVARVLPRWASWLWASRHGLFRVTDAPVDLAGNRIEVADDEPVWVAHPCELDPVTIAQWRHAAPEQLARATPLAVPTLAAAQVVLDEVRRGHDLVEFACAAGFYTVSDTTMQRWMRHRDEIYEIDLDLRSGDLDATELPPHVLQELARDVLAVATR